MGERRGGTRGAADGGPTGWAEREKERAGSAGTAARGWTKPEERGVGVGFLAWHRGIDTPVGTQRHQRLRRPTSLHPNDRTHPRSAPLLLCRFLLSLQLVQLPTHNPPMRSSRRANLIALTRASSIRRVFHVVREMSRNCRNCAQERALGKRGLAKQRIICAERISWQEKS